jgi:hypothetical protein
MGLDHDDFGLNQSKIINVIDSKSRERDAGGKPGSTFPHPALERGKKAIARSESGVASMDGLTKIQYRVTLEKKWRASS